MLFDESAGSCQGHSTIRSVTNFCAGPCGESNVNEGMKEQTLSEPSSLPFLAKTSLLPIGRMFDVISIGSSVVIGDFSFSFDIFCIF